MKTILFFLSKLINKYFASYGGFHKDCWSHIYLSLINSISIGVCFFLSLYFVETLQFNMIQMGFMMSIYGVGMMAGGIIGGKLCDNFNPKLIVIISSFLQGIAFICLPNISAISYLSFNLLILGLSSYTFKTANNMSLLLECEQDHDLRLKGLGLLYAASNFGLGISGVLIGLFATFGYKNIFYAAGILLICSGFYKLAIKSNNNLNCKLKKLYNKDEIIINKENESNNNILIKLVLLSLFFVGIIISQLSSTYPVYLKEAFPFLGISAVSILFTLDTVLIVLFQAPLTAYTSTINSLSVLGLGALLMGIGMLILIFSKSTFFILAILSCCLWTVGEMLYLPTAQSICYEKSNILKKGQNVGYFQATYAMSTVIGPVLGGYLYSELGSSDVVF